MRVEIWSDVVCPWCYLGKRRFERALAAFDHRDDVEVVYRSFELDPAAPVGATRPTVDVLAGKYGMSVEQAVDAQRQMEQRAAGDGLTFRMGALRSGNTRDAHRLVHLANAHGRQADMVERLHRAYFTDEQSVFDTGSLADLATDVGLDRAEVTRGLADNAYDEAVTADEATGRSLGITGVPFFAIERRFGVSGAQPAEVLTAALQRAWDELAAPATS